MSSQKTCSYCGQATQLTKEHLWPRGIIARAKNINTSYFGKLEKFVDAELTIRDVCAPCNNGPLSELDGYICQLFDGQFNRQVPPRQSRTFIYDYQKLLRWLLKISYNTARANGTTVDVLAKHSQYILHGGTPPSDVSIRLELIHPSPNPKWSPESDALKVIPAESIRCCRIEMPETPLPGATVRLVAIYGYYFWLVFVPSGLNSEALHSGLPGKLISSKKGRMSTFASRGMLELHQNWAMNPKASESMRQLTEKRNTKKA